MNAPDFFKPWIKGHKWGIWISIFLLLLSALVQFGLFALNANYVLSHFGAQPEDVSFASQLTYAGILATLTVQFRFLQYFERRPYLVIIIVTGILISIANMYTTDIYVFMLLRLLTGINICMLAGCSLTLFFASLPPAKSTLIGSSVFYGTIITNVTLVGILSAWVTDNFDWQNIYRYILIFQVFTLLITLVLLNKNTGGRKYPLYQVDWASYVIFMSSCICFAYAMIYGPKYYWFTDMRIQSTMFLAVAGFVTFIYRQFQLKRPYLHPHVFKFKKFIAGLLLLLVYYGVKDSINLVYAYCAIVVRWDNYQVMWIGAVNLAGFLLFLFISIRLILAKKFTPSSFFIPGFLILLVYHVWMYYIFTPDLSFADLVIPMFLQGAAAGFLFVPIILYMVSSLPAYTGFTGITIAAFTRFTATLNSIAGYYTLQLFYNQLNKEAFLAHVTTLDSNFTERLNQFVQLYRSKGFTADQSNAIATGNVFRSLTIQSQLITDMHVFKLMIIVILFVLGVLVAIPLFTRVNHFIQTRFNKTPIPLAGK